MTIKEKLRYVFLPYLLVSVGFIAVWLFSYKWLVIEWNVVQIKEFTLSFIFPLIFTFLLVHFVLRPFLKVYYTQTDEILYFIAFVTMWMPCILITINLEKSGEIIEIQTIEEVKQFPNEKYFNVVDYQVDTIVGASEIRSYISSDSELISNLYCISPFKNNKAIWFGVRYYQSPKRKKSEAKNQALITAFLKDKFEEYKETVKKRPVYFEQVRYSDNYDGFKTAINKLEKVPEPIILEAKYERFEERFHNKYLGFYVYGVLSVVFLLFVLFKKAHRFNYLRWRIWQRKKPSLFEKSDTYFNPYWTFRYLIIIGTIAAIFFFIHIVFFGLSVINPTAEDLLKVGALQYADLRSGKFWHFLTQIFAFSGAYHLVMDLMLIMLASLFSIESQSTIKQIITTFFIGAIIGAWVTILYYPDDLVSGLIFGNMSVLGLFIVSQWQTEYRPIFAIVFNLFMLGIYFYAVPTYLIGSIVSFIIGIMLYFIFER